MQDSIALYNALVKAQELYHSKYQVDITTIVSLPALALKIFRMKFLDKLIPILNGVTDRFIRGSYYGGAVDFYKATNIHADINERENLYYYDVNSLYPYAMLKPMPMNLIRSYNDKECKDINLDNFFGFLEVDVECSDSISKPVLPVKYLGKTIYPKGSWTATYFSQELKEVMKLGYTVSKIHKAYEFDSDILFHDYIMEMYQLKKYAKGAERWIAKLLQNSLYGLFGRNKETLHSIIINADNLDNYITTNIIKNIIHVSEDKLTLLVLGNVESDITTKLNSIFNANVTQFYKVVKSNIAIASAITSYARIHMLKYKLSDSVYYTDTDSIFTDKPLNISEISSELGFMKDELDGNVISKAYFLGIKQYGYCYFDKNSNRVEKSVWAMHEV